MQRLRVGVDVWRVVVPLLALLYLGVFGALTAEAALNPNPGLQVAPSASGELTLTGWAPGLYNVAGFIANAGSSFNPVANPYPSGNPGADFSQRTEYFAGVLNGTTTDTGASAQLYCIDIDTDTYQGVQYHLGTWDAASVPNVGYVARILNEYYPSVPGQPDGLDPDTRAAAVQAAVWYFSDRYVVDNSANPTLHSAVAAIVNRVRSEGPLITPPPPSLTITPPPDVSAPAGTPIGPFTVTSSDSTTPITISSDVLMYTDATLGTQIPNGSPLPANGEVWLSSSAA